MRISWGATRFVLLIGPIVIKFMRPRPFWWVNRFFHYGRKKKLQERLRARDNNIYMGILRCIFAGIEANIIEYRLWKACPSPSLMPTIFSFLGLVNIQMRGAPIQERELSLCPFQDLAKLFPDLVDFGKPEHFCWFWGEIRFVDYGKEEIVQHISHVIWEREAQKRRAFAVP